MLFIGHYHAVCGGRWRNVVTNLVPGMQWQSPLFRRIGKEPRVGALLVSIRIDDAGSLRAVRIEDLIHYVKPE